ncbi:hypothetical protein [Natronococcus jeotgali]|uniref:Uncharacterized protein n=1 Tax=Natronococcus jeotgali DSM 18795 TaxID=1227498 RepID=L9X459_9EURY|nr:hypothetical protein [Natronococcus jeotgali]ELY56407.1 hypothetical protein C492_14936 [Natronococcus jeotgali DSM 18795]
MDRRKVLVGGASALTTLVAGYVGDLQSKPSAGRGASDGHPGNANPGTGGDGPNGVPGFVPEKVELESVDVHIEEFQRRGRTLTVELATTTRDLVQLRDELEELPPALEDGIEDAEGFFSRIETVETTLAHVSGVKLATAQLEGDTLREYADGELTEAELIAASRHRIDLV